MNGNRTDDKNERNESPSVRPGIDETIGPEQAKDALDAGLAAAFGPGESVVIGNASESVLKSLGLTLDSVPRVVLRDAIEEGSAPVVRPASAEVPVGESESRYRLDGEIARGGMGAILKGRDTDLGRDLAIKVLLESHKDKPEAVVRFIEEAQIGGQLQHPGIAPVYELGQFSDQRPFFSMKLVKGKTLSALLLERPDLTVDRPNFLRIFEHICATLAYAHSRGVVHRDLKPANVMVGAFGEVQVMDWGLAKVLAAGGVSDEKKTHEAQQGKSVIETMRSLGRDTPDSFGSKTRMGSVMGTPAYIAPEQALGEIDRLDERADVFGLGAILCEILTGQPPYVGADGTDVLRKASRANLSDCFARLEQCDADPELLDIVHECLALEPEDRPKNASIVSAQVNAYLESIESRLHEAEIAAVRAQAEAEQERQRRRRLVRSTAIGVVLLVVAATIGLAVRSVVNDKQRAIRAEGLVDTLLSADVAEVPYILAQMGSYRKWVDPLLETESDQLTDGSAQRMHVALALLPIDESQVDYLASQLPVGTLDQFPVVRDALSPHKQRITDALWQLAEDEQQEARLRFQAAAALATYTPDNERWEKISPFVANHLTKAVFSVSLERWLGHLDPAGPHFAKPLATILEDRGSSQKQREAAAFALAVFLKDEPAELADVILLADEFAEFSPLITALQPHSEAIRLQLLDELHAPMPDSPTEAQRDAQWNRQSLAAVALVQLGHADEAWPLLEFTPDTSLRSLFIHHLGKLRADDEQRAAKMESEDDAAIRQALIESFGSQHKESITAALWDRVVRQLQDLHRDDPDPGVHASASWTLRKWGVTLPELPVGEPVRTEEQKLRFDKLTAEVADIRQRIAASDQELPVRQVAWERTLPEQPTELLVSLGEGLANHYPLDETEGTETANAVESQPGGIYAGLGQPEWVPGVVGNAVRLDGKGGHFNCGDGFNPERTDAFSYGCWFLFQNNQKKYNPLLAKTDFSRGIEFGIQEDRVFAALRHEGLDNAIKVSVLTPVVAGEWHHAVIAYDGSSTAAGVTIYIDGRADAEVATSDRLSETIRNDVELQIRSGSPVAIDDVRIYSRRLNEVEASQLYQSGLRALVGVPPETRTPEQQALLAATYRPQDEPLQRLEDQLAAAEAALRGARWEGARRWYVNSQGQTMVVIPSPSINEQSDIDYDFAIASHEVTVADFSKYRPNHSAKRTATNGNFPVHLVSWYWTAQYCNWLSEKDGIAMDQWIYEPNANGSFLDGMTVKANYRELEGYRLPSDEEWEYACRAGTTSTYSFGEPESLIGRYGHTVATSTGLSQPVGSLLPNRLGLFDMHGSLWEWCLDSPKGGLSPVRAQGSRVLRGGSYGRRPWNAGSSQGVANPALYKDTFIGFRVARSLP